MHRNGYRLRTAVLCAALLAGRADAATFIVSTTADTGAGSLRQAITDANAATDADTITFAIEAAGVPQIVPATNLPTITQPVVLDGTTQSPAGRVELSGTTTKGLVVSGSGVTIRGFVVNGFTSAGISISGAGGNVVQGNYIGTNVAGTASASPSSASGIEIVSSGGNTIGGLTAAARNLISGNGTGIWFSGSAATPSVVVGNWIGTNATGNGALANTGAGIDSFLTSGHTIGGTDPGAGNVISGNGSDGLSLSGDGYVLLGNLVGVGADGVTPVANGRHGVRLYNTAENSIVGGTAPNHIAHNASAGVLLAVNAGVANAILGNSIHDNGALGIDIAGAGVNANDSGDGDGGSNRGQNFPVLDAAFAGGASIGGVLDSTADTTFTIELFANSTCDASGFGEGAELVGSVIAVTDATGHAAFTAPLSRELTALEMVTATATDADGNTSEFSRCAPQSVATTTTTSTSTTAVPTTSSTSSTVPSTSTTLSSETTTSTTLPEEATTTSSTTLAAGSTTTSTTLPGGSTTTSTTLAGAATTTSTTDAPATTSTSTTLDGESTTTSTTLPGGPTTTSTTLAGATTTTSTTDAPATTSTSTTLDGASTTTSTTLPGGATTTSTTLTGATTTTSTTEAPASTSTSTTLAGGSTTTSTTLPGGTTSSTTTLPPSSTTTSSTLVATSTTSTSSSSTTAPVASTTVTTSSSSSTTDVPPTTSTTLPSGCDPELTFDTIDCRLADLDAALDATPELAAVRAPVDKHLGKARSLTGKAESRCTAAKRGPARKSLRMVRLRLRMLGKALHARAVRKAVPPALLEPIDQAATALADDVRAFTSSLDCQ